MEKKKEKEIGELEYSPPIIKHQEILQIKAVYLKHIKKNARHRSYKLLYMIVSTYLLYSDSKPHPLNNHANQLKNMFRQ